MSYFDEARARWQTYLPARGQAEAVQGELMRAVEKLRDEAKRNGNMNWRADHAMLVTFIRDTLVQSGLFDAPAVSEIERDAERLLDFEHPEADRLTDRVVEWARAHPEPVPRESNPELRI